MSAPAHRRRRSAGARRGHVLVEAMASAAILFWALSGLTAGLLAGSKLIGTAAADHAATDAVAGQVERMRSLPVSHPAWAAGITALGVPGHPTWSLVTTVVDEVDINAGLPPPLTYKHAVISITYGTSTHFAEVYK
ncbi:MAG TPA: hypothetical protein VFB81_14130 [Myxococcales bacterium]|nr:hypothetical protein [Myxococcales bacterium]